MKIVVSEAATVPPPGRPWTDDMRSMVEDLQSRGQTFRLPGAFFMKANQTYVLHPEFHNKMKLRLQKDFEHQLERTLYYGR